MNQRTPFDNAPCSIARTLNIIGEWWTLLILRDLFYDIRKFSEIKEHLGISKKVLTNRLSTLLKNEIVRKKRYNPKENPPRYEYVLTKKGEKLFPILVSLMNWGDEHIFKGTNAPVRLVDKRSQKFIIPVLIDENTGKPIVYGDVGVSKDSQI